MSTPAPKTTLRIVDNTQAVPDILNGVVFVQGITERGPVNDPSKLIYSWPQFEQLFGGLIEESDFPLHCRILLERGCILRVNSVKKSALNSVIMISNNETVAEDLFQLESKYPGVSYNYDDPNGLYVEFTAPSDSELGTFNMYVYFNGNLVETYENLSTDSLVLDQALGNSKWVTFNGLEDLSGITNLTPNFANFEFAGGSDGDLVTDTEMSDFTAFDDFDDSYFLVVPAEGTEAVHIAGNAYQVMRKDLRYYASIATSSDSSTITTARSSLPFNRGISYTSGGWKVLDPLTGTIREISEVSHFVANAANTFRLEAPWFSFSGPTNPVPNVFGPVYNYGTKAKFTELDVLNRNHVNMAINRNGINMFWGNFTAQRENTHLKFISTHNLILFMSKSLIPVMETFIERPLDIPLFKIIFETVKPLLDSLITGRAIFSYDWKGDQNASNLSELQINDPDDVQMGKYKVSLGIVRINPLQEFELTIELTRAGITIE